MARRGRFMSGGTGGSNMSQLVYNIMRQQLSRQVNGMVDAYVNQTDYRGQGVPSAEDVISFLQEYSSNQWVNQSDRDTVMETIAKIRGIEDGRVENRLVAAIEAAPGDVAAVVEYVAFLKDKIDTAASPNLLDEAKTKLFKTLTVLAGNIGTYYGQGKISSEEFDRQKELILGEFATNSSEYRQINTTFVGAKFAEEYDRYNTALATASAEGASQYSGGLKDMKGWLKQTIQDMADQGLATLDEDGNVISGIDAAMEAQRRLAETDSKITKIGAAIAKEAAGKRFNNVLAKTSKFLKLVNNTLGSNYQNVAQFMSNQIDVQRFYGNASPATVGDPNYMGEGALMETVFGSGNSLLSAAKGSGNADTYKALNDISKKYGRNTLVDDAAIILENWMSGTGGIGSDPIKNAKSTDKLISDYESLIGRLGGTIPASELEIHKRTLQAIKDARAGKAVDFNEVSAFDLANPYSTKYDEATGGITSVFQTSLDLIFNSSSTANELATGGKVVSGSVGANGNWQFGGAVEEGDNSFLTYMDPSTKRVIGVAPINIMRKNINDELEAVGYLYNLGNGKFVVRAKVGNDKWVTYNEGYDPFSKTAGLSYGEFKTKYISRIVTADTNGTLSSTQVSEFVLPDNGTTQATEEGTDGANIADPNDIALSGLRDKINAIPRSINNKDIVDRRTAVEVAQAQGAATGTTLEPLIGAMYTGVPAFSTGGNIAGPASMTNTLAGIDFRAGERASLSDNLSGYAFRNTPLADFFGTSAGQNFRAGERADLGIKPIASAPKTPARPLPGQIGGR